MDPKFRERKRIRLGDLRAVRRELVACYTAWQRSELGCEEVRAGTLALTRIASLDQGQLIEERVADLERRLAAEQQQARPNGGAAAYHARP